MAISFQMTFDCADPSKMAAFWADLLGYEVEPPPEGYDSWPAFLVELGVPESEWNGLSAIVSPGLPRIFFQRVPEPKVAKNRVHPDLDVGGGKSGAERREIIDVTVQRALHLGARQLYVMDEPEKDQYFVVLADVEGNEFCVQ